MNSPVWLHRRLLNWLDLYAWAIDAHVEELITPEQLHVTLATARGRVDWGLLGDLEADEIIIPEGAKSMGFLGTDGSVRALMFTNDQLSARQAAISRVMSIDHADDYNPHVTLLRRAELKPRYPYAGRLVFGPEIAGRFIANIPIPQRATNRNDIRTLLGLPPQDDAVVARSEQKHLRAKRDRAASARKERGSRDADNAAKAARRGFYEDDDE